MHADPTQSKGCKISRRAEAHLRKALGLPKRTRGGQTGNRNRLRHGFHARDAMALRAKLRDLLIRSRKLVARIKRIAHELNALSQVEPHGAAVGSPRLSSPRTIRSRRASPERSTKP